MKRVKRRIPVNPYDIPGMESWLAELAGQGLFLEKFGASRAVFTTGAPSPGTRYRLEPMGGVVDGEYTAYAAAQGWRWVCPLAATFHVYRADDPDAPELHTDPVAQSYTLDALTKRLWRSSIILVALVLLIVGMLGSIYLFSPWPWLSAVEGSFMNQLLLVVVEVIAAGCFLAQANGIRRLRRQLREGVPLHHEVDYRKARRTTLLLNCLSILLVLSSIAMILPMFAGTGGRWSKPLDEVTGEIPFLSLEELEQAPGYVSKPSAYRPGGQDLNHWARYEWTPLAVHYEVDQRGQVPGRTDADGADYTCALSMDYYDLTFAFLAAPVLDDLVYRYTEHHYFPEEYTVAETAWPGLDRAVVAQDNDWPGCRVFASRGGKVVYLDYSGALDADTLLDAAVRLLNG